MSVYRWYDITEYETHRIENVDVKESITSPCVDLDPDVKNTSPEITVTNSSAQVKGQKGIADTNRMFRSPLVMLLTLDVQHIHFSCRKPTSNLQRLISSGMVTAVY